VYKIARKEVSVYRWWEEASRFDLPKPDCDAERFGYVVESDPLRSDSKPVKRTALGRFRHENADLTLAKDGRVVVYMGDDQAGEFIYKYVSTMTPDRKTMFINIQHPGEPADEVNDPTQPNQYSQWSDGPNGVRPRSATIDVRRSDGRTIGS
jgi:secreted PhoX family phosphatase